MKSMVNFTKSFKRSNVVSFGSSVTTAIIGQNSCCFISVAMKNYFSLASNRTKLHSCYCTTNDQYCYHPDAYMKAVKRRINNHNGKLKRAMRTMRTISQLRTRIGTSYRAESNNVKNYNLKETDKMLTISHDEKSDSEKNNYETTTTATTTTKYANNDNDENGVVVYESEFANIVRSLRKVSLFCGTVGCIGIPLVVWYKNMMKRSSNDFLQDSLETYETITESTAIIQNIISGQFAFDSSEKQLFILSSVVFGTMLISATTIIHYIFAPYVFKIIRIPIRQCKNKSKPAGNIQTKLMKDKHVLYKIILCSFLLQPKEICLLVDLTENNPHNNDSLFWTQPPPKQYYRPLCNAMLVMKHTNDKNISFHSSSNNATTLSTIIPLFLHPEFFITINDNTLYSKYFSFLRSSIGSQKELEQEDDSRSSVSKTTINDAKGNPDDYLK